MTKNIKSFVVARAIARELSEDNPQEAAKLVGQLEGAFYKKATDAGYLIIGKPEFTWFAAPNFEGTVYQWRGRRMYVGRTKIKEYLMLKEIADGKFNEIF